MKSYFCIQTYPNSAKQKKALNGLFSVNIKLIKLS